MASYSFKFCLALVMCYCVFVAEVVAHEYWLDPIDSSLRLGESAIVDVRNGTNFSGSAFPYDKSKFKSITISNINGTINYSGRLGDYPAIHPEMTAIGLHSINVETNPTVLEYETWHKFNTFLAYHSLENIKVEHKQRKLPKSDITERYFRLAKTLVQVNNTGKLILEEQGLEAISTHNAFKATGALFEMLLLDNPYSNIKTLRIKLIYQGEPLADRQTELFWKGDKMQRLTATTDAQGVASFTLLGNGDYLLNAVNVIRPEKDDVHWQSHWASITFER